MAADVLLCSDPPLFHAVVDIQDLLPTACYRSAPTKNDLVSSGSFTCGMLIVDPPEGIEGRVVLNAGNGSLFKGHPLDQVLDETIALPTAVPRSGIGGDWRFLFTNKPVSDRNPLTIGAEECRITLYDGVSDSGHAIYAAGNCQLFEKFDTAVIYESHFLAKAAVETSGAMEFQISYMTLCGRDATMVAQVAPDSQRISGEYFCPGMSKPEPFMALRE